MRIRINGNVCTSPDEVRMCASPKAARFIEEYFADGDTIVAHTSGSTGTPKEIHLRKSDMRASAQLTNERFGITAESLLYLCLSPDYIAGKMMLVRAIEADAEIVEQKPSNEPMAGYDSNRRVSLLAVVPSQLGYLINHPEYLSLIDTIIIGGGALSDRIERWLAEKGVNAFKTYGMTETCSHVALAEVSSTRSPFTAIGNVTFGTDERGCLVIHAPQFTHPDIVTNDIVDLLDPQRFYWRGRYDNVINTGGLKVFPEEVEEAIARVLPRAKFFVTSRPSEKWGEELLLVLEYPSLADGERKEGEVHPGLITRLKTLLPTHAIPRHYVALPTLPTTPTGKPLRRLHT